MSATAIQLQPDTLVNLDGTWCKVLSRDRLGATFRTLEARPVSITKTHGELAELYFAQPRRLQIAFQTASGVPDGVAENLKRSIESFDAKRQNEALLRLDYVTACDRLFLAREHKRTVAGFGAIARKVALMRRAMAADRDEIDPEQVGLEKFGGSTVQKWYLRWRKGGRTLAALVPLHDRKGMNAPRVDREVELLIEKHVNEDWLILEAPPLAQVIGLIRASVARLNEGRGQPLDLPDQKTVRRWVKANIAKYDEVYKREGKAAAEDLFRDVKAAPQPTQPLQEVEADHTLLDVLLREDDDERSLTRGKKAKRTKRVWLTIAICAATRMIVGFHIGVERPSWTSIMHCLRMAVLPKDLTGIRVKTAWPVFGVPQVLKLDNGKEFHSRSMKAAAGQLRMELRYMPRRKPHLKGKVERFIGTVARDFCAYLSGRTFRDVRERGDYPAEARAAFTLGQLVELFTIWVVDVYHNRSHGGLYGCTPLRRWEDLAGFGVRLPPSADDLYPLLALVVSRTIQRSGITFLGLNYRSEILAGVRRRKGFHFGEEFLVKVDPADIAHLLVLTDEKAGWLAVPCTDPRIVEGTTLAEWRNVVALSRKMTEAGRRVAESTMFEAMRLLREEGRRAGALPVRSTQADIDWARDSLDEPIFEVAPDPDDAEGGHERGRVARRRPTRGDASPTAALGFRQDAGVAPRTASPSSPPATTVEPPYSVDEDAASELDDIEGE